MPRTLFPVPLQCPDVQRLFTGWMAGTIGSETRGRVEGHLLACDNCSQEFALKLETFPLDERFARIPPCPQCNRGGVS